MENQKLIKKQNQICTPKMSMITSVILRIKIQQLIKSWKKKSKKSKTRLMVLKEWISTQKAYIQDLDTIINFIQKPFVQQKIITEQEQRILFPNLQSMKALSLRLLQQLQNIVKDWNPHHTLIGAKLSHFHKFFMIYREYCNNFLKGQKILKNVRIFFPDQTKLIEAKLIQKKKLDFQSYTIKPVQRPPKYQLLIKEYHKNLPLNHSDKKPLQDALQKYHQVNDANNSSMDCQIRSQKMIDLDVTYKNIISQKSNRIYVEQFRAYTWDYMCKLHLFNNMLFIIEQNPEDQQIYYDKFGKNKGRRIILDGASFVQCVMDGKYFINRILVCGKQETVHLFFLSQQQRNTFYTSVKAVIRQLYKIQTHRKSVWSQIAEKKKNFSKLLQQQTLNEQSTITEPISNGCKFKITVAGVEKRLLSSLNSQTLFILKICLSYPHKTFQYIYLKFQQLLKLERNLNIQFPHSFIPILDDHPTSMSYFDIKKNKTKIIQFRSMYIQRYLNFVFRNEQIVKKKGEQICKNIGIDLQLWKFVSSDTNQCMCDKCLNFQNNKNLSFYQQIIDQYKKLSQQVNLNLIPKKIKDKTLETQYLNKKFCPFFSFNLQKTISKLPIQQFKSLQERLIFLQCYIGRLNYNLIERPIKEKNILLKIYFTSLKDDQYFKININKETTIAQLLDQISYRFRLKTIADFGLFLYYNETPRLIDQDQKIYDIIQQVDLEIQEEKQKESSWGFYKSFTSFKKWGQQLIIGKKQKLFLKKYIFLDKNIEIQACEKNPQRYRIIIDQIFFCFKNQLLIVSLINMQVICSLFYCINELDKLYGINQANFQKDKLKKILPQCKQNLLKSQDFIKRVFSHLQQCKLILQKQIQKINILYKVLLHLVADIQTWHTFFVQVFNYDPMTLPGDNKQLLLGVNRDNLIVLRHKKVEPLLKLPLMSLKYKVTAFSIFIQTDQRSYRFDGQLMYNVKKMIEMYKIINKRWEQEVTKSKFGKKQKSSMVNNSVSISKIFL